MCSSQLRRGAKPLAGEEAAERLSEIGNEPHGPLQRRENCHSGEDVGRNRKVDPTIIIGLTSIVGSWRRQDAYSTDSASHDGPSPDSEYIYPRLHPTYVPPGCSFSSIPSVHAHCCHSPPLSFTNSKMFNKVAAIVLAAAVLGAHAQSSAATAPGGIPSGITTCSLGCIQQSLSAGNCQAMQVPFICTGPFVRVLMFISV